MAIVGLVFVLASLLSLLRQRRLRWRDARDELFMVGLAVIFVVQLIAGRRLVHDPSSEDPVETTTVLVVVCFLLGIERAWELVGGPSISIGREMAALARRDHDRPSEDAADAEDA